MNMPSNITHLPKSNPVPTKLPRVVNQEGLPTTKVPISGV